MHPLIHDAFRQILAERKPFGRILEVGAIPSNGSLLSIDVIQDHERIGVSLESPRRFRGFEILQMDANDLSAFEAASFGCVLSNAVFEHDPYFWLSLAEIRRVLAPGGLFVVGVPGYVEEGELSRLGMPMDGERRDADLQNATLTFRCHGAPGDYYRFSRTAVAEILMQGCEDVSVATVMMPPRIIAHGIKPAHTTAAAGQSSANPAETFDVERFLRHARGGISVDEGQALRRYARAGSEGVVVEIGSFRGKSAVALASGVAERSPSPADAKVFCVEPH
ncbi:MAG TPA: methyltransferase domain-containing protein, partial [Caulobacteraceae bacterium]